jgi:hypothetical protein
VKRSELKQLIKEEIQNILNESSTDYPNKIKLTPKDPNHPVKYFVLQKVKKKRPGSSTPRYITIYPRGMDDYYEVDQIDFENETLDAY